MDSLDPHKAVAAGTKEVLFNVFEGLVKPDSEGNLNDAVAESHTISEDGKVYTFTLRDGVKFHDGTTVTAEDVKYSIDRCADTSNGDPLVSAFLAIDSVNIIDEKTVEIVLKEGNTHFQSIPQDGNMFNSNPFMDIQKAFIFNECICPATVAHQESGERYLEYLEKLKEALQAAGDSETVEALNLSLIHI